MIVIGQFFFRYRNAIFPLVMVFAVLLARPHYSFGNQAMDTVVDLFGIVMILAGQTLRVVTIGYEYIRRGGRDGRVYAEDLVQGGVFAHCRNPLYVGNILIAVGFLFVLGQAGLIAIGAPLVVLVYVAIVSAEEEYLSGRFGDTYRAYCDSVNRWIPTWKGLRESLAPMRFNWKRVLVKEYNTIFAVLTALLVIQTWTLILEGQMSDGRWVMVMATCCILLAGYLSTRVLKKKRVLRG
ncbi:MAG: isoprenylcysteine carboxylmethyltransferase family protein [Thiohalocapsa sp.]